MKLFRNNYSECVKTGAVFLAAAQLIYLPVAHASQLSELAEQMPAKSWAELTGTENFGQHLFNDGEGRQILQYTDNGIWDPISRQFLFMGAGHYQHSIFVSYSDDTNTWRDDLPLPIPCMYDDGNLCGGHAYDNLAIDVVGRKFLWKNRSDVYGYNLTNNSWSHISTVPLVYEDVTGSLDFFPEMGSSGSLFVVETGYVYANDRSSNTWSRPTQNQLSMGPYHIFVEYNPVHNVVIFGGGNDSRDVYKLDKSGNITTMKQAPVGLGINQSIITVDPVSGLYLVIGNGDLFYSYDVTTDTWQRQSGSIPVLHPEIDGPQVFGIVAAPVSNYGVTMFVKYNYDQSKIYLYKHSTSGGQPPDYVPPASILDLQAE